MGSLGWVPLDADLPLGSLTVSVRHDSVLVQTFPHEVASQPTDKAVMLLPLEVVHCLGHLSAEPVQWVITRWLSILLLQIGR